MNRITLDIESYAEVNIRDVGAAAYAAHPCTRIYCIMWKRPQDDFVAQWIISDDPRENYGRFLAFHHDVLGKIVVAHNIEFERFMLCNGLHRIPGLPKAELQAVLAHLHKPQAWSCTMSRAKVFGLPGSLEALGDVLYISIKKDMEGRAIMAKLAAPKKPTKADPLNYWCLREHADLYTRLYQYCVEDVKATEQLDMMLPEIDGTERKVFDAHILCNSYGVPLDYPLTKTLYDLATEQAEETKHELINATGISPTQVAKLLEKLQADGASIENTQANTLKDLIDSEDFKDLSEDSKNLVLARASLGKTAFKKFKAMCSYAHKDYTHGSDGIRMRGTFRYYGAHTGRWSGSGPQFQSMPGAPAELKDPAEVVTLADAVSSSLPIDRSVFSMVFGDPIDVAQMLIRPVVKAPEGKTFVVVDMSQIEARVAAWVARDTAKLEVFASGKDIYTHAAAKTLNKKPEDVTPTERKVQGKVTELALGYGGYLGAFASMAKVYGVHLPDNEAKAIIHAWRNANQPVVESWKAVEGRFYMVAAGAARQQGLDVGTGGERLIFRRETVMGRAWVSIELPVGRKLWYLEPIGRVADNKFHLSHQVFKTAATSFTEHTYGGKIFQNICQAIARDCLAAKMLEIKARLGLDLILHIHDELVYEVLATEANNLSKEVSTIMAEPVSWASGLPLASKGYIAHRYYKD